MPASLNCVGCKKNLTVPDELVGQNCRCPLCGAVFLVPTTVVFPYRQGSLTPSSPPTVRGDTDQFLSPRGREEIDQGPSLSGRGVGVRGEGNGEGRESESASVAFSIPEQKQSAFQPYRAALDGPSPADYSVTPDPSWDEKGEGDAAIRNNPILLLAGGGAALLVLIGFVVGILYLFGAFSGSKGAVDLRYLPDDCGLIASVRVAAAKDSAFFQELKRAFPEIENELASAWSPFKFEPWLEDATRLRDRPPTTKKPEKKLEHLNLNNIAHITVGGKLAGRLSSLLHVWVFTTVRPVTAEQVESEIKSLTEQAFTKLTVKDHVLYEGKRVSF